MLSVKKIIFLGIITGLISCSNPNPLSNLFPDDNDLRGTGSSLTLQPGDLVSDFTFYKSDGTTDSLSNVLSTQNGVVMYFTMWCSACESHMNHIRTTIKPFYPLVTFYLIDYVSGSIQSVYDNQTVLGYSDFNAALDYNQDLTEMFSATMSTTILIDKNSVVVMNEDFKDGQRLIDSLNSLP